MYDGTHWNVPPISSSASNKIGSSPFSLSVLRAVSPAGPPAGGRRESGQRVSSCVGWGSGSDEYEAGLTADDGDVRHRKQIRSRKDPWLVVMWSVCCSVVVMGW
jgi:hypothetical protein